MEPSGLNDKHRMGRQIHCEREGEEGGGQEGVCCTKWLMSASNYCEPDSDVAQTGDCLIMPPPLTRDRRGLRSPDTPYWASINMINHQRDDSGKMYTLRSGVGPEECLWELVLCWSSHITLFSLVDHHHTSEMSFPLYSVKLKRVKLIKMIFHYLNFSFTLFTEGSLPLAGGDSGQIIRDLTDDYIILFCPTLLYIPKMENIKLVLPQTNN